MTCKVDTDKLTDYESGKTYTFKNTATAETNDGSMGNAEQEQEWTEKKNSQELKVVDKSGAWNSDTRQIEYSICLNPDGRDIVKGSETLTLKDVMTYGSIVSAMQDGEWIPKDYTVNAWLIPDSVKLYRGIPQEDGMLAKGEEIKDWKWTVETGEDPYYRVNHWSAITATNLPDETPMILEYTYQFESDMPKNWYSTGTAYVENSAELIGTNYNDNKRQDDTIWAKQEHGGQVTLGKRYVIYKVSMGSYGTTLQGAEFKLQKYEGSEYVDTGDTYTTDDEGKIVIQWQKSDAEIKYTPNTLYRLIETKAPHGYLIPEDPESNAVYFYFRDTDDKTYVLPGNLPENAYDLTEGSHMAYVENAASQNEDYTLPETGGTGTTPFRTVGLAIMSLALLSNGILKRRREGE